MSVTKLTIFAAVTALLIVVSVLRPTRHGVFRWLAWESLLVLILLNVGNWFRDPLSPAQICSWVLLAASICLAVEGVRLLRKIGRPSDELEATTVLVAVGAYRYVRHPLYASLLLLGWGAFLKDPTPLAGALAAAASVFLVATARVEERLNREKFGDEYVEYMKRTKMFIPYLF